MSNDTDKNSKINLRNKLTLKRTNSSHNILNPTFKNQSNHDTSNTENLNQNQSFKEEENLQKSNEDTLADFKSPKEETVRKPLLSKFRANTDKVKKKLISSKSKAKSTKTKTNVNQPTIESSFFKPQSSNTNNSLSESSFVKPLPLNQQEIKESFPCPLCLKPFKDEITCTNHMKTCAVKSNIPIKQVLDAKRLQERQAEERKAMGLPAAPIIPEKKKVFRSKNYSTGDDPQLQLVLAMSESLYEAEKMVELEQAAILAGIPSDCVKQMTDEDRRTTLQNFGFTTNKPVIDNVVNRTKKRKLHGPTILQSRSKEDKERVLTERIACIITGEDALTQAQQSTPVDQQKKTITVLRSQILKNIEQKSNRLWDLTRLTKKKSNFYVEKLKLHFLQTNDQNQDSETPNSEQCDDENDKNISSNTSIEYEPMDIDILINKSIDSEIKMGKTEKASCEMDYVKNTISNWAQAFNKQPNSDIIIFVKNNKHIFAHRLVFYVQCANILLSTEANDSIKYSKIKDKICWFERDYVSALAFLEFIYCGCITKNVNVFDNKELLIEVEALAKVYKVESLFSYLKLKQNELKSRRFTVSDNRMDYQNDNQASRASTSNDQFFNDSSMQQCHVCNAKKNITFENKRVQTCDIETKAIISYENKQTQTNVKKKSDITRSNKSSTKKNISFGDSLQKIDLISNNKCEKKEVPKKKKTKTSDTQKKSNVDTSLSTNDETNSSLLKKNHVSRRFTTSPDLFTSEDEKEIISSPTIPKCILAENNENNGNSNISLNTKSNTENSENSNISLNTKSNTENNENSNISLNTKSNTETNESILKKDPEIENENEFELSTSQQTIINLSISESPESPQNDRAITPTLQKDIYDIKTPKNSPKRLDSDCEEISIVSQHMQSQNVSNSNEQKPEDDQMSRAVTPEHVVATKIEPGDLEDNKNFEISGNVDDDSIYNAVTPPRSDETQYEHIEAIINKPKNKIDLFLNKIRRKNARDILDTDSDSDINTPEPMPQRRRRNPFLKKDRDDSCDYLNKETEKCDNKKVISMLEKDILEGTLKNIQNKQSESIQNLETSNKKATSSNLKSELLDESIEFDDVEIIYSNSCESINHSSLNKCEKNDNQKSCSSSVIHDEDQDMSLDETGISMYSKYKKMHEHENSIEKYRNELNLFPKNNLPNVQSVNLKDNEDPENNSLMSKTNSSKGNKMVKTQPATEDVTLVYDSDDELQNNLKSSSLMKRNNEYNSNVELNSTSNHKRSQNVSSYFDLVENEISKIINSPSNETSKNHIINLSDDSEEENINMEEKKYSNESSYKNDQKEAEELSKKQYDDCDAEVDKIMKSNLHFSNDEESLQKESKNSSGLEENLNISSGKQSKVINLSPISIISSPEICKSIDDDLDNFKTKSTCKSDSNKSQTIEAHKKNELKTRSVDNEWFDDIDEYDWVTNLDNERSARKQNESAYYNLNIRNTSKKKLTSEHNFYKDKNSSQSQSTSPQSTSQNVQISTTVSPILSQSKRKTQFREDNITHRKSSKISAETTRKFQVKSSSTSNLTDFQISQEHKLSRSTSFNTPTKRNTPINEHNDTSTDYSLLGTPELHKELKKFGLKPQTKKNSKILLQHIRSEIQKTSSENVAPKKRANTDSSSDNDEPPCKKKILKAKATKTIPKKKNQSKTVNSSETCPIIAEEMDYNEIDAVNILEDSVSIKDAFYKLIKTNRELYNKVLTYEPLPLEKLHLTLKENGFKCKINSLMDFLDEQCITFQVQTGKNDDRRKKSKKKDS